MRPDIDFHPVAMSHARWFDTALADEQIARNTSSIPHPLPNEFGSRWIREWQDLAARKAGVRIVGTTAGDQPFGSAGLKITGPGSGEISFWIARPYWRRGLGGLIAREIVARAGDFGLSSLTAGHFSDNLGSLHILTTLGFHPLDQDADIYSLCRGENVQTFRYIMQLNG